jgi:hypothetical protein
MVEGVFFHLLSAAINGRLSIYLNFVSLL